MAVRPNRIAGSHEDRGAFTVSLRGLSTVLPLELLGRGLLAPSRPGQALETLGRRVGAGRGSIIAWPGVGARRGAPWRPGQVDPASCAEGLGVGCRLKDWAAKEGVALSFEGGVRKSRWRPRLRREGGKGSNSPL